MKNDEIFITDGAVQVMKFHGSYQQFDRERKRPDGRKSYQFMLRLKMPGGEFPASLYQVLDDISRKNGNNTLRATTRCAWQVHGILKSDLRDVFSSIMNAGGSCVGACGDVSRNVMCTPAPFTGPLYGHARWVSKMIGELFAPQTNAFSEIWLDGEKAATLEYWKNDIDMGSVHEILRNDNGNGVVYPDHVEPIYGDTYLPRKFKVGVTVPGDNSLDIYTQDIGVVCVPDSSGMVVGYNLIVGGGMGRMHRKETTFARVGDHLGYVPKDKLWEALKAIVATQRDHGNRNVRVNARMKYLVDRLGIDGFRVLVESYFGDKFHPYRKLPEWKYEDWLGWHEQGDGNLFLGLLVENGRVKDEGDFKLRTALRRITDAYEFDMVVTPNQNLILKNITLNQKDGIEAILKEHSVKLATEYPENRRIAMACPALPMCGLASSEAERIMPSVVDRMTALFDEMELGVPVTMRMTGCPNGCARPYMAELGMVGSGPSTYQLWLGGCPNQTRLAWPYLQKVKEDKLEEELRPILEMYRQRGMAKEAFGDFCYRMGIDAISKFVEEYHGSSVSGLVIDVGKKGVVEEGVKKDARITVVRGAPKVTVVETSEGKKKGAEPEDVVEAPATEMSEVSVASSSGKAGVAASASSGVEASSSQEEKRVEGTIAKKKKKGARPRLTVSDDIMERLKNIAALRDMSASKVADEIITAYLSGVEDDDVGVGEEQEAA